MYKKILLTLDVTQGIHIPARKTPCIGPITEPEKLLMTWNMLPNFPASKPSRILEAPAIAAENTLLYDKYKLYDKYTRDT